MNEKLYITNVYCELCRKVLGFVIHGERYPRMYCHECEEPLRKLRAEAAKMIADYRAAL